MPAIVQLDLSQVLTSADEFICRWIELPTSVRTIAAFENLLRGKQLGGQLQGGSLRFLRAGGIVIDTACLIGDLIEVVAGGGEAAAHRLAQEAAGQAAASKQSGGSGAGDQQPQAAQSDAAATDLAQGSAAAASAAEAGTIAGGTSAGDAAAWQAFRQLSRPERLLAAERMSVEERAAIRAAGVPEEAMEDGRVLPALQRLGGHGPPIEVGHNRRCGHCGVLKPRVMYFRYMWDQPAHRSVCSHCETHLKCYTCPDHCCIKRPSAFSKRQARWWGGDRRCKECIAGTEAAKGAAAADRRAPDAAAAEVPEQAAADGAEQAAETAGEAARAAAEHRAAEHRAAEQVAKDAENAEGADGESAAEEDSAAEGEAAAEVAAGAAAEQKAAEQNSAEKMAAEEMLQLQVQWGETAAAQKAAVEKAAAAEEEAADSSDEMEGADADFGQPHVVSTSVVPEAERRAAVAAEADAEQERQHSIREAGGLLAGDKLVFRHPADDTELVGRRMPGNLKSLGTEHSFQPESTCVTQQEWLPSSGELVVVAGAADGAGWLVAADGGRVPGAWAFRGEHLSRVFELGVLGTIWDVDSDEEEVPVEAFHWPSPVDLDHGDGWFQKDELMGTISSHRKVRVVAVEKYARGGEMLLVEDAEEVEHDEETDFDVDLDFDQGRSNTDGDPLDEEPDGTAGSSDGCVVEMAAADGNIFRMVKRSSVWIRKSSWDTLPLQ